MTQAFNDSGVALVIALLAMLILSALGLALVLSTAVEVGIAGQFRAGQEAFYAADAAVQYAVDELGKSVDWDAVLSGAVSSAFTSGSPSQVQLSDGSTVDLSQATNVLNCGHPTACTPPEMDAPTGERPWGTNNPRWQLFAYGPLNAIVATRSVNSAMFIAAWVADDGSENDGNPAVDGDDPLLNPGSGVLAVRGEAFGPGRIHRVVEATVGRSLAAASSGSRVISWREIR